MKRRIFSLIFVVAFCLGAACFPSFAEGLRAAASLADITPSPGVELWGYSDRKGPATGTLDPLFARVLLLDDGRNAVALVTLDLGRTFGVSQIDYIRKVVKERFRVGDVMLMASHTHSGPVIDEEYEAGIPAWEQAALDKIISAIGEASKRLTPAVIGVGTGQALLGHNRRYMQSDGKVRMLWRNSTGQPTGLIDPTVGVIRVDSGDGKPIAVLVNYACHPVIFGSDNLRYSADYPGEMSRTVERQVGSGVICFFVQGGAGDINPLLDKTPLAENADVMMKATGAALGQEVVRVFKTIMPAVSDHPEIAVARDEMSFRNRWSRAALMKNITAAYGPNPPPRILRYLSDPLKAQVTTVVINREIALVGLPGEPFVAFQLSLKLRSPLRYTFLCGYANGYVAYFPTIRDAAAGGYGADSMVTRVEVGAGERMIDRGLIHILTILGKLKPTPEKP